MNKEINKQCFIKKQLSKQTAILKNNAVDRKKTKNRKKPKKRLNSRPTAKYITNKEMHSLNGNIFVVLQMESNFVLSVRTSGTERFSDLIGAVFGATAGHETHIESYELFPACDVGESHVILLVFASFSDFGDDLNHIMHMINGNTTVVKTGDRYKLISPPLQTLTVSKIPDPPKQGPPPALDLDGMNWGHNYGIRVRTNDDLMYRFIDHEPICGFKPFGRIDCRRPLGPTSNLPIPQAPIPPPIAKTSRLPHVRCNDRLCYEFPPMEERVKEKFGAFENGETRVKPVIEPAECIPQRALDGEHPDSDVLDENFEEVCGEVVRTHSLEYSTVKYEGDNRLLSQTMSPIAERDYVLGSWIIEEPLDTFGNLFHKTAVWLGFEEAAWTVLDKCFLDPDSRREFLFAPHLVSCAIADSRNETSLDVLKTNTRARLMRISSFPVEDTVAIRVFAGSELVALLVGMNVLNLRGAVSSGRYTAQWSATDSNVHLTGQLAGTPKFTRLDTDLKRRPSRRPKVLWSIVKGLILLVLLATLIGAVIFGASILGMFRDMRRSQSIGTTGAPSSEAYQSVSFGISTTSENLLLAWRARQLQSATLKQLATVCLQADHPTTNSTTNCSLSLLMNGST